MESLDVASMALGLLINLAEHEPAARPALAAAQLPGRRRMVPLLCRLMQVSQHPFSVCCLQRNTDGPTERDLPFSI